MLERKISGCRNSIKTWQEIRLNDHFTIAEGLVYYMSHNDCFWDLKRSRFTVSVICVNPAIPQLEGSRSTDRWRYTKTSMESKKENHS